MAMNIQGASAVLGVVALIWLFAFAWAVLNYVLTSLSLYTVAKRRGVPTPGLAWVPVIWVWTLGGICDQYDGTRGITRKWRSVLLTLTIIVMASFLLVWILFFAQAMRIASVYQYNYNYYNNDPGAIAQLVGTLSGGFVLFLVAAAVAAALSICQTICIFKFFESCRPNDAVKFLLLSLLVPFASPFCFMSCRNYDLGMPQPQQPYYPPYPPQPPVNYDQPPYQSYQ